MTSYLLQDHEAVNTLNIENAKDFTFCFKLSPYYFIYMKFPLTTYGKGKLTLDLSLRSFMILGPGSKIMKLS